MLGTPTREEIHAMNPNYTEFKFPQIKAHPWTKVFSKRMPQDAVDLVSAHQAQRSSASVAYMPRRCPLQACFGATVLPAAQHLHCAANDGWHACHVVVGFKIWWVSLAPVGSESAASASSQVM